MPIYVFDVDFFYIIIVFSHTYVDAVDTVEVSLYHWAPLSNFTVMERSFISSLIYSASSETEMESPLRWKKSV